MRFKTTLMTALLIVLFCSPLSPAQNDSEPRPAPVVLDGELLFVIRAGAQTFSPSFRAQTAGSRIGNIARDYTIQPEDITVTDVGIGTMISAGDEFIMPVFDADAEAEGIERNELANRWAGIIRQEIAEFRKEHGIWVIVTGILSLLLATLVLVGLIYMTGRFARRIERAINESSRIRSVRFASFEFITAERIKAFMLGCVSLAKLAAILIIFYTYIHVGLGFFPWTRGISQRLQGQFLDVLARFGSKVLAQLPGLAFVVVVIFITRSVLKTVRLFFDQVRRGRVTIGTIDADLADPTYKIIRLLVIVFAAIVAYPYIPWSDSPAFQGISILLGVILSLGSTSAVANILAGLTLLYSRTFREGDVVKLEDTLGIVLQLKVMVTRLKTFQNEEIIIPNAHILAGQVVNYSEKAKTDGLILHTSVTIGYDAPWRKVEELLLAAARSTRHVLQSPPPFVLQTSLDDFYVTYKLNVYTDLPHTMPQAYSELHRNIQDRFNEAGVEIMSPHYAQIRDGSHTTIPEQYLPPDYAPQPIRIVETDKAAEKAGDGKAIRKASGSE